MIPKGYLSKSNSDPIVKTKFGGFCNVPNAGKGDFVAMKNLTFDEASHLTVREVKRYLKGLTGQIMGMFFHGERVCFFVGDAEGTHLCISVADSSEQFTKIKLYNSKYPRPLKWTLVGNRLFIPTLGKVVDLDAFCADSFTTTFNGGVYEHCYDDEGNEIDGNCIRFPFPVTGFAGGERVNLTLHYPSGDERLTITPWNVEQKWGETYFHVNDYDLPEEAREVEISISRSMLSFSDTAFHSKRMWGCTTNKVYFSAQNEPFLWKGNMALAEGEAGVLEADVGTALTHFCMVGNRLFVLSPTKVYEITGDDSDSFKLVLRLSMGVEYSNAKATAAVGDALFFMSGNDVYRYEGNTLSCVSECLLPLANGIAAGDRNHYYLYAQTVNGESGLYVYHNKEGVWSFEESTPLFTLYCGQGYVIGMLNKSVNQDIAGVALLRTDGDAVRRFDEFSSLAGTPPTDEGAISSYGEIEFGRVPGEKIAYSALAIDLDMESDSTLTLSVCYEGDIYVPVGTVRGKKKRGTKVFSLPRRRSESCKLILEGSGNFTVYSVVLK